MSFLDEIQNKIETACNKDDGRQEKEKRHHHVARPMFVGVSKRQTVNKASLNQKKTGKQKDKSANETEAGGKEPAAEHAKFLITIAQCNTYNPLTHKTGKKEQSGQHAGELGYHKAVNHPLLQHPVLQVKTHWHDH